jgi:DNA-binding SARP family transcriptional activator
VEFRVLGPLEVLDDGRPLALGGTKQRSLLALLLLNANHAVSTDRLIDEVWGDAAEGAARTLQVYVSNLRKLLTSNERSGSELLLTQKPGYSMRLEETQLDLLGFEARCGQGQQLLAAGDNHAAARRLREALALWRGPALADLAFEPFAQAEATRLEGLRLAVLEDRIEADLALGRHTEVVHELESLVVAQPLRERLWGQLMVALYRSGRQSDALRACARLRRILGEELGIEPSPDLVRLEDAILMHKPELDWTPVPGEGRPLGRSLPTGVVTFLLTDVVGSTRQWQSAPQAMAQALARHDQILAEAVGDRGGNLLKTKGEGDSTFSVFTRATDAVAAALSAQLSLAAEVWPGGTELSVRMALHTGEALERDGDYFGTAVNRAARLRAVTAGGQIFLSQSTAEVVVDHLPEDVGLAELGSQRLRDLDRPERLFVLTEPRLLPVPVPTADLEPPAEQPPLPARLASSGLFVGRQAEMERLLGLWKEAVSGTLSVVLVAGEPGVGKTRLAAEFARAAHAEGATVLYGHCDENLGAPYQPVAEALRSYVISCPTRALESHVAVYGGELARLVPELRRRLPEAPSPLPAESEAERWRLFEAVGGLLADASRVAPVALVMDDLHWADQTTLLLLRHLARSPGHSALLMLGSYRETELAASHPLGETLADLRRDRLAERMTLRGLDEDETIALIATRTGADPEPDFGGAVHSATEGNPFFIEEVLTHRAEREARTGRSLSLEELGVPEGVREVVGRRLARLSPATQQVLALASVVGREFDLELLLLVGETTEDQLLDCLDESLASRLIKEQLPVAGRYAFSHALIRQTLFDELASMRRARLHRRIGETLEHRYQLGQRDELSSLAHHFSEGAPAGTAAKAARYSLMAAERASDQLAFEEAAEFLRRGLAALASQGHPDEAVRADSLLALAQCQLAMFDVSSAKKVAEQAADAARALDSPERLGRAAVLRSYNITMGQPDSRAVELCTEALAALGDEHVSLRGQIMAALARYRYFAEGDVDAADELARDALVLARRAGDRNALTIAIHARAVTLANMHSPWDVIQLAEELLSLDAESRDRTIQVYGHRIRALPRLAMGDVSGFDADTADVHRYGTELHMTQYLAEAALWRALRAIFSGEFEAAERISAEVLVHAQGEPDLVASALGQIVYLRAEQGRLPEVEFMLVAGLQDNPQMAVIRAGLTLCRARLGKLEEAAADLEHFAHDGLTTLPRDFMWAASLTLLAEACAHVGNRNLAAAVEQQLRPYRGLLVIEGLGIACAGAADRYLGILAATRDRWSEAEELYRAALALEQRSGAIPNLARTKLWYATMLRSRGQEHDPLRGALATDALATAHKLGMADVASRASLLLED